MPNGTSSNPTQGFKFGNGELRGLEITASIAPLSKQNWLYHCMGVAVGGNDTDVAGKHNSSSSFVQRHVPLNKTQKQEMACDEKGGGCLCLGNTIAAIFGLYYYEGCNEPRNNWKVTQVTTEGTFVINMRMWNPNYEYVANAFEKSLGTDNRKSLGPRLLVREPINPLVAMDSTSFVGSHWVPESTRNKGTFEAGFYLPAVFKHASSLAFGTAAGDVTPVQPLKLICQLKKEEVVPRTSLAPFYGQHWYEVEGQNVSGVYRQSGVTTTRSDNFSTVELARELHSLLGDVIQKPTDGLDALCLGFVAPKAHWLYPHWGERGSKVTELGKQRISAESKKYQQNPYQQCPAWTKRSELRAGAGGTGWYLDRDAVEQIVKEKGHVAVTDAKPEVQIGHMCFALSGVDGPESVRLPPAKDKGKAQANGKGKAKAIPLAANPNPTRESRYRGKAGPSAANYDYESGPDDESDSRTP